MRETDLNLWKLQVFCRVIEEKSFSGAARSLGISQPTVSSHIAALERAVGARLFDRVDAEIALTRAGEVLFAEARKVLECHRQAVQTVQDFLGVATGALRIGGSTIPGTYILPDYIRRFRESYPGIQVELASANSGSILARLQEGEIEVGVTGEKPGSERFRSFPFEEDELVLAVPKGHPLAGMKSIPIAELERHPHVLREAGSGTRALVERALSRRGFELPHRVPVACQIGSSEGVRQAVLANLGVSILSTRAIADDVATGRLAALTLEGVDLKRRFHVVTSARRTLSPPGKAFLAFLKQPPGKAGKARRT